jgi:hypothetical protein
MSAGVGPNVDCSRKRAAAAGVASGDGDELPGEDEVDDADPLVHPNIATEQARTARKLNSRR